MSARLSHHDAANGLAECMSDISEAEYSAGWLSDCEWDLWEALVQWRETGTGMWGSYDISRHMPELDRLQRTAEGWVWWLDGETFVPIDRWRRLIAARGAHGVLVPSNEALNAEVPQ